MKGSTSSVGLHLEAGEILSVSSEKLDLVDLMMFNVWPNFNPNTTFTPTPTPIRSTTEMTTTSEKTTTQTTLTSQTNPTTISHMTTTMKAGCSRQLRETHLCLIALLYLIITNFCS